ncbi:hypothetical protein [uncultured Paraglaciecola sp.]|uniref:hypothetical protein n=1 Tax=uncultured Paraglaciecola sp. TaxID=1765024 RepID=UPI0025914F3E|nr:hypothetical protein [uncultured Paraglaciecola sp.]
MNWTDMDLFRGVDLGDSFVLDWSCTSNSFVIKVEASLWPESKHYSPPVNGEYTCYKNASVTFKNIKSIKGIVPVNEASPTTDPDGSIDYGNIDALTSNLGQFNICGRFGNVVINGGEVSFSVSP